MSSRKPSKWDRLKRAAARLPTPGVVQIVEWWPWIKPVAFGFVAAAGSFLYLWVQRIPDWLAVAFVLLGIFATSVFVIRQIMQHWRRITRTFRWWGVSLRPEGSGLNVTVQRQMVGQRRDLGIRELSEVRIHSAAAEGFNHSQQPIPEARVFVRSLKTNQTVAGYLDGYRPEMTYGIPGRCQFRIHMLFPHSTPAAKGPMAEGMTQEDFRDFMGSFELVLEYGKKRKRVHFPLWWSEAIIAYRQEALDPKMDPARPRVTRRV